MVFPQIIRGRNQWKGNPYSDDIHSGDMFKIMDPGLINSPWHVEIQRYIKENT